MATRTGDSAPAATERPAEAEQRHAGTEFPGSDPQQSTLKPRPRLLGAGELVSATAALALLVLVFAAKWYGVAGVPDPSAARPAISTAINGWQGLPVVRWVILLTIIVAVGSVLLHLSQRTHGATTDTSRLVTVLGVIASVALIYRVLVALPSSDRVIDQKLGAVLGLGCALIITLGGRQSILEQRAPGARPAPRRRPRRRAGGPRRDE
jgi:hypothetical protein